MTFDTSCLRNDIITQIVRLLHMQFGFLYTVSHVTHLNFLLFSFIFLEKIVKIKVMFLSAKVVTIVSGRVDTKQPDKL